MHPQFDTLLVVVVPVATFALIMEWEVMVVAERVAAQQEQQTQVEEEVAVDRFK
jgi:hypothetical protein